MRKLLITVSLLLQSFALCTLAQELQQVKGLTSIDYSFPQGRVKVKFPSMIKPGDKISGSFIIEPTGSNARQQERAMEELLKKEFFINGVSKGTLQQMVEGNGIGFKVNDIKSFIVPERFVITLTGKDPITIPFEPIDAAGTHACMIPSHANTGSPLRIRGNFDGEATTSVFTINNKRVQVLAESPRQSIIEFPADAKGSQTLTLVENGQQQCSQPVSGVDMQLSAGKLDLMRGESTHIDVLITGLDKLPDVARLTLNNLTPGVVVMPGGNHQLEILSPDSIQSTWNKRYVVQSIRTGSFAVNVNLELPEYYANANPTDTVPEGSVRKFCDCKPNASLVVIPGSDGKISYKVNGKPACEGGHGIGIATFERCALRNVTYEWNITAGESDASFVGPKSSDSITIRSSGTNPAYVVSVKVTVTCNDGKSCTWEQSANNIGQVGSPGTVARPPKERPPDPPPDPKKCTCTSAPAIVRAGGGGANMAFTVNVNAACTGSFGTGTQQRCAVGPITYNWSVAGDPIADIPGAKNGQNVVVRTTGKGTFTLNVNGTITCNDGSYCSYMATLKVDVDSPEVKACNVVLEDDNAPLMNGGLKAAYKGTKTINRDDYILLGAEGKDVDIVKWKCEIAGDCEDQPSEKKVFLSSRVRFTWQITNGDGEFVKLGCLPNMVRNDEGDNIIFKPPVIPLPVLTPDTTAETSVTLTIVDDNATQAIDPDVPRQITIKTKRFRNRPDIYEVEVIADDGTNNIENVNIADSTIATCKPEPLEWTSDRDLVAPVISLPNVADNDKMVWGQWIVLVAADQRDGDQTTFKCKSQNECPTAPTPRTFEDNVVWNWSVTGGGRILSDETGRFIVYEAPKHSTKEVTEVTIKVKAKNPGGLGAKKGDRESPEGRIVLKIYQPGIKLEHPAITWLPTNDNNVTITSSLKYKDAGTWRDALAHMCRIQFFEFDSVSREKGISMNSPVDDANTCPDMKFINENEHEAYEEGNNDECAGIFQKARTVAPVRTYSITIHSLDYGGYTDVISFGDKNRGEGGVSARPNYFSIPVLAADVRHPAGRPKRKIYEDNRVTVPHDIDENRIADNGWRVVGGARVNDPATNSTDTDNTPAGDGFNGDGLTNYEEYRGFMVNDGGNLAHTRTDPATKNIFICNENTLPINLYRRVSGLHVHEITSDQYDDNRVINFNYNNRLHVVNQHGLKLVSKDNGPARRLGHAKTRFNPDRPATPRYMTEIVVYDTEIAQVSQQKGLNVALKTEKTTAHELLHGNNVCHHGEQDETAEDKFDVQQGLRSGDWNCVMRYDNVGENKPGRPFPEAIPNALCTAINGAGANRNNIFGNAANLRGNCAGQIRVSDVGDVPRICGNRQ